MVRSLVASLFLTLIASSAAAATKTWTGAASTFWSNGGNWVGGVAPADGDALVFPDGAANRDMINDLAGVDLVSVAFTGVAPSEAYSAAGEAITLSGGFTAQCCHVVTWSIPTTLTASQTFSGSAPVILAGGLNLSGFTLTMSLDTVTVSGPLAGTGLFDVPATSHVNFTAASPSFTGDIRLLNNGTINVSGSIPNGVVGGEGNISGNGTLPVVSVMSTPVTVGDDPGAGCCGNPHSIGILSTKNLNLLGGELNLDLAGTTPGTTHDQVSVTGTVDVSSVFLQLSWPGAPPAPAQAFTIINNDGTDAVTGQFVGPGFVPFEENGTFVMSGVTFRITYKGGDGNDVVLTAIAPVVPQIRTWTGAVNNLWSAGGNWSGGIAPADDAELVFPDGASNRAMVNDLAGLDVKTVRFTGTDPAQGYSASGNAITISGGFTAACCPPITWSIPITLVHSQQFGDAGAGVVNFAGPIDLGGYTLWLEPGKTTISGSLIGSGRFDLGGTYGGLNFTGTSTFTGVFAFTGPSKLNLMGTIANPDVGPEGYVSGTGTMAGLHLFSSPVSPGDDPGAFCCGNPHTTGILRPGPFSLDSNSDLFIDLVGPTPGTGHDQLAVTGTVRLDAATDTRLQVSMPSGPVTAGQRFVIVSNDGSDAVNGTFTGLPERTTFTAGGVPFRITYQGGDGNDIELGALVSTTTSLTASKNPTVAFEPFELTATVAPATATGSVVFRDGATVLSTVAVGAGGIAKATVALAAGVHSLTADFTGTLAFTDSSSAPLSQTVERGAVALSISVDALMTRVGDPLTVTVHAPAASPSTGAATGSVSVTIGTATQTATLSNGIVQLTFNGLAAGSYTLNASYDGDANYLPATATAAAEIMPVPIPTLGTYALMLCALGLAAAGWLAMKT